MNEVLIVGAGPTGLVLALWLTKLGVRVRVIDKSTAAGTTSRALAVQARTLELYRQLDLTAAVLSRGHRVPAVNLWVRGRRVAHLLFQDIGAALTPYPFLHMFPQDEHEQLLVGRLARCGVTVERSTELLDFVEAGDVITARLRLPSGAQESCSARYLAGCDGARSRVRDTLHSGFPGGTYRHLFYVADIQGAGPCVNGELHVDLDEADFLGVFPLAPATRARLIGTVRDARADRPDSLRFEDVSQRAIGNLQLKVEKVNWFSTYHVHHRVTQSFRHGRAFLLGDAAHIHSPAGGQGMNTGIGDAINLAWKLAAVLTDRAAPALLDSYEPERKRFAQALVATTDKIFSFATAQGRIADFVRTRVAPLVLSRALEFHSLRTFLFRTVSQVKVNYRGNTLSAGMAGRVHGGDRLPWAGPEVSDNYTNLTLIGWQVHVYGRARAELNAWCDTHEVPLQVFAWHPAYAAAGLVRDALYLLRPDTYLALVDPSASVRALAAYFQSRALTQLSPLP